MICLHIIFKVKSWRFGCLKETCFITNIYLYVGFSCFSAFDLEHQYMANIIILKPWDRSYEVRAACKIILLFKNHVMLVWNGGVSNMTYIVTWRLSCKFILKYQRYHNKMWMNVCVHGSFTMKTFALFQV